MTLLGLALLGGVTGLDAVSCAQTMIARPIVAGPLAGLILGDPPAGMLLGATLEVLTLYQLPIGATRYWDTGPAAVVGTACFDATAGGTSGLLLALGAGVLVGWVGGWSVDSLRRFNARLVVVGDAPDPRARVARGHVAAVGLDFVRALVLTSLGLGLTAVVAVPAPAGRAVAWAIGILLVSCVGLALGADGRAMVEGRKVWAALAAAAGLSAILTVWLG